MPLQVQSNTTQTGRQPVDLWGKALQTLDGDLKSRLNFKNSTKRNILEKTLKTAEEKKEVCLRKRWKFKRNGKEVVLRDVIEKIIKWLDHFKAVGDTAAQFDTAHAALPWAGVRFLLRVAVNDTHIFGSTIEALEIVSHLIAQYAIFESVHIRRNTAAATELEPVLTEMYAEMLIFLARSMKYFQTPTATRMLKSALAAFESDENQLLKRITAAEAKVLAIATLSDAEMLNCFRDLEQPIRRMADQAAIYATSLEDARYREILNWLSVSCFIEHQERHAELRIQGTGQWFLNHREYLEWQSSSVSSMFILHGMAGSGKSSLVSAVIGSFIEGSSNQPSAAPFAYFYCSKNASEVDRSNPKEIMRSIVRQLATTSVIGKSLHSAIVNEYGVREEKAKVDGFDVPRLGLQDCVRLILEITGSVSATIILDAIDEVPPKSRHELLDALQQIVKDADDVVKVFLTTRDDDQILAMLSSASKLRIAADENRLDIEKFVHSQVSLAINSRRLLGGDVSSELQADLSQALIDGAGEIFQLVIWQIEALCDMRHEIDIRKAMKHFSEDTLERMYTEILARIRTTETYSKKIAINAFSILHCLCEQLSSSSFLTAVAQMDEDHSTDLQLPELLRSCLGLIVLDSKMNVLRFAHTSVQEFLESQHEFLSSKVNGLMAVSCLNTYLHGSPVKLNVGLRPKEYFYHYSTLYWAEHCKAAFRSDTNIKLLELLKQFIFEENEISLAFLGWLEDIGEYSKVLPGHHFLSRELSSALSQKPTPLFTASVFGLAIILDDIVKISDFDCNRKNDLGQTGLYLACFSGQRNIVSILLDHGADINISGGRLGNPLQASCFEGYIEITQLLVANGADPKLKGKFETALDASIEGDNEDIGLLLLEKGFEVKDQSEYDRILQLASQSGHIKIVQQLQKMHGSSFGNSGSAKCKAIQAAISRGQISVVQRFIKKSQNPRNDLPGDSIAIAALSGQNRMILLLLQNGLDIEHAGQFGTPLRAASLLGNESTVRLLLDSGAKNSGISSLGNALEAAAMNGHTSIAKLLLQEGVDVNINGGWSGNALQAAAYRGHLKLVMMFLDAGASIYSSGFTKDAFHAAVEGGHINILRLLLDRGYNDSSTGYSSVLAGPPSLPFASNKDYLQEASPTHQYTDREEFIERDFFERDFFALESAASNGNHEIVKEILTDPRLRTSRKEIGEAFKQASGNGHEDVVKLFLTIEHIDPHLRTALNDAIKFALKNAAFNDHLDVVKLLITHLQQLQSMDDQVSKSGIVAIYLDIEFYVLHPGCRGDHVSIVTTAVNLLKQHYSSMQMKQMYIAVLYETASENGIEVMKFLFSVTQFDNDILLQAMKRTSEFGHSELLLYLLEKHPLDKDGRRACLNIAALNGFSKVVEILFREYSDMDLISEEPVENSALPFEKWSENKSFSSQQPRTRQKNALQAAFSRFSDSCFYRPRRENRRENRADQEATILFLLEKGADPNQADEDSTPLLITAIKRTSPTVVEMMIRKGASLLKSPEGRAMALKVTTSRAIGAASILKLLLAADAPLQETEPEQTSNDIDLKLVLRKTLRAFGNIDPVRFATDSLLFKSPSIHDLLHNGPGAVIKILLKILPAESTEDERYGHLLQMAVVVQDREYIDLLLQRGLDVNVQGNYYGTALQCAARFGYFELVQHLLGLGAKVNILKGQHETALRAAVLGGHEKVVNLLLEHGADFSLREGTQSSTPSIHILDIAFNTANWIIIKALIMAGAAESGSDEHASHKLPTLKAGCRLGNLELIQLFIDNKVDVRLSEQATALHLACGAGCKSMVQVLLDHGADLELEVKVRVKVKAKDEDGERFASMTPLQMTAYIGHLSVLSLLIESGANIDYYNLHGTALSLASRESNLNIVEELLRCGASIVDPSGRWNALAEASQSHCKPLIELLLDELPESIEQYACAAALSAAAASKDESVFQMLIAHGVAVSSSTLSQACAASLTNSALMLLRAGVDIDGENEQGGNALQVAAFFQNETMVDILIEHGADVNKVSRKYGSPLQAALEGLLEPILRLSSENYSHQDELRDYDTCSDVEPPRPISEKVSCCKKIVGIFLDHGADINTTPRNYGNPLHLASFLGSASLVNLMLGRGAEVDTVCDRFSTPLFAALEGYSCHRIVPLLLEAGTNVNYISAKYGTALHYACELQSVVMVRMLLEYGAEANAVCGSHGSPLSAALSRKSDLPDEDPCQQIAEILLGEENPVKIEQRDLIAAVNRIHGPSYSMERSFGVDLLKILLEHDATLQATEPVLIAAIKQLSSADAGSLELLLDRDRGLGIKEAMIEATRDPEILKVLLNHRPICRITPEILAKMSESLCCSSDYSRGSNSKLYELLRLLIEHETDISITEDIVLLFLRADYTETKQNPIGFLFERNLNLKVTEPMLKAAKTVDHMKLLLKHAPGMKLNPEVLEVVGEIWQKADAVAKGMDPLRKLFLSREMAASREMILLLLAHDRTVKVPERLLTRMLSSDRWGVGALNFLNTILDRGTNICLTADILTELVLTQPHFSERMDKNQVQEIKIRILSLLLKYNKKVKFTGDIRTAIEREEESEGGAEMAALVYRLEDKGNEQT